MKARPSTEAVRVNQPDKSAIASAIAQLKRSERGQQALSDFRQLLNNGGDGLDPENWKALSILCHAFASDGYVLALL